MQTVLIYNVYAIDLEIIYNVWRRRVSLGFWIADMAFLMDEIPLRLKEIENPTLKITAKTVFKDPETGFYTLPQRSIPVYDLDQINFIRHIFYTEPLWRIMPAKALTEDEITVRITHNSLKGKQSLLIEKVGFYGELKKLYQMDESSIPKRPIKFVIDLERIKTLLAQMVQSTYFDQPRLAVEIYRDFIELHQFTPQPIVLAEALSFFISRRKEPKLKREKSSGAYTTFIKA